MIEIDKNKAEELKKVYLQLLFDPKCITFFAIEQFIIEERSSYHKNWLFQEKKKTTYWVRDLVIWGYNPTKRFWGTIDREAAQKRFILYYNLLDLKDAYDSHIFEPLHRLDIIKSRSSFNKAEIKQ